MDELPKHARALLELASEADDPTALERARGDAAVRAALAQRGLHDVPGLDAPPRPELGASATAARAALGLKLGIAATALVGAVIATRTLWPAAPEPRSKSSEESLAPTPVRGPSEPRSSEYTPSPVTPEQSSPVEVAPVRKETRRAARDVKPAGDDAALARELKVLASVNELVRAAEYSQALGLLDRTESASAPHALREERSALRVLALCGLEPNAHALRERERFLASSPRSVLAARVHNACMAGEGEVEVEREGERR